MTRRSAARRTTAAAPVRNPDELPSLRRRQPAAYWAAVLGAGAVLLTTFGWLLSAFT